MNSKQIIYLLSGSFGAVALLLFAFLVYPLILDIQKGSNEILVARATMVTSQLENRELERFQKNYKDYQPNLAKADALLSDAKDPIDAIKFVEKIAAESFIATDIKLIPSQGETIGTWPALVFDIQANGGFAGMLAFGEKLETGPYAVSIRKFSMKKHQNIGEDKSKTVAGAIDGEFLVHIAAE